MLVAPLPVLLLSALTAVVTDATNSYSCFWVVVSPEQVIVGPSTTTGCPQTLFHELQVRSQK